MISGDRRRFGAVDVHYPPVGGAWAALVVAAEARFATLIDERVASLDEIAPYRPGQFFARELPAIRAVISQADDVDLVVIDGYVDLDPDGRPGLGAYLHTDVGVPAVGVAKTAFRTATHAVAIYRGRATRPLYVTAIGVRIEQAAAMVADMAGRHRIPDALRRVDSLARNARPGTH